MTPSFRERVASILFDMEGKYLSSETKTNSEIRAEALAEILSLVRGIVPSEKDAFSNLGERDTSRECGFNACRQAILNEIGEGDEK